MQRKRRAASVDWCRWGTHRVNRWRRDYSGEIESNPFRCKSWRCPRCRPWVGLVDYARIASALCSRDRWLYLVLTMPSTDHSNPDRWSVYREAGRRWRDRLLPALTREHGPIEYVQTWEQHRTGVPHVNVVLRSDSLVDLVLRLGFRATRAPPGSHARGSIGRVLVWRSELRRVARRSGFGPSLWIEPSWVRADSGERPHAGLASYLVKLARTLGVEAPERERGEALAAELSRSAQKSSDQTPIEAPIGFRRLRASRGLLPPRHRGDPNFTGKLGAASDPPWTWGTVRNVELNRALRIAHAVGTLRELEARGLTIPECVRTVLSSWERVTSETPLAPSAGRFSREAVSASTDSTTT